MNKSLSITLFIAFSLLFLEVALSFGYQLLGEAYERMAETGIPNIPQ